MVEEIVKVFSKKHNFLYFSFDYVKRDKIWLVVEERNFRHIPKELVANAFDRNNHLEEYKKSLDKTI